MSTVRLPLMMSVCGLCLMAQDPTFVYTNNDHFFLQPNSVSAFAVAANGALTPVPGSPFATGGTGVGGGTIIDTSNRITTAIVKDLLYATNSGSNNISAFSINPATGVLTPVAGSPFATGGSADNGGISLATTPDDNFLIAANFGSNTITVFSVAANGALSQVAGSPFPGGAGGPPFGIKVTPDGKFLAVAHASNTVSMFNISATGGLTPVLGSPFPAGGMGALLGIDCNCAGTHLYAVEGIPGSAVVSAQNIAPNGTLSPIAGSPFVGPGSQGGGIVLSPDDSKLFVTNLVGFSVTAFSVASSGTLAVVPGSPFPTSRFPFGIATNAAGTLLYTVNISNTINGFSIAPNGTLTSVPGSPFSNGGTGVTFSLAVFPPKSCCPAPVISGTSATPNVLWPPDHKFVEVTIDYTVTDPCPNTCALTVASNELVNGTGDGNTSPDWEVIDSHHVLLRAERAGDGTGRIYTITITCTNSTNKLSSTKTTTVFVPHDQGQ